MPNDDKKRALINENKINLLDVREKGELYSSGKIENAMSYPLSKLLDQMNRKTDKSLLEYIANPMEELQFQDLY